MEPYLPDLDLCLIMTLHPGFGGQSFRPEMMEKVRRAKELRTSLGATFDLEVDGGITAETAQLALENGANVLVAGTSIFRAGDYGGCDSCVAKSLGAAALRRFWTLGGTCFRTSPVVEFI